MGVRGLWEVAKPIARPVTLESLRKKRLAVDASIWIYQFLKAVRDREGNALRNAHVIGFFRRICKLLYFDIKPVFVFDGEAPTLKKVTIERRKERRQGRRQAASQTAAKLLTIQLQRLAAKAAEESQGKVSNKKGKEKLSKEPELDPKPTGDDIPHNAVYFEERNSTVRTSTKPFRAEDQYHLPEVGPELPVDITDPRLMTEEELNEYAAEFGSQINHGLYDTSFIDFESPEFYSLPKTTQYQLLNTARLRSRLRMGYSADQLDEMFPNRMDFSKFQIQRVTQRNFLTQKVMGLVGMDEDLSRRLAGDKSREYILKKNDSGWTLGVEDGVIELDEKGEVKVKREGEEEEVDDDDDDIEFEDIPLENGGEVEIEDKADIPQEASTPQEVSFLPDALKNFEALVQRQKFYDERKVVVGVNDGEGKEISRSVGESENKYEYTSDSEDDSNLMKAIKSSSLLFKGDDKKVNEEESLSESKSKAKSSEMLPPWFIESDSETEDKQEAVSGIKAIEKIDDDMDDSGLISYEYGQKVLEEMHNKEKEQEIVEISDDEVEVVREVGEDLELESEGEMEDVEVVEVKDLVQEAKVERDVEEAEVEVGVEAEEEVEAEPEPKLEEEPEPEPEVHTEAKEERDVSEAEEAEADAEVYDIQEAPIAEVPEAEVQEVPKSEVTEGDLPLRAELGATGPGSARPPEALDEVQLELAEHEAQIDLEEEEELNESLLQELEESERFTKLLNNGLINNKSKEDYEKEIDDLRQQHQKEVRDADEVNQTMISECQELLKRFGIPYITAPMEAEAQCAKLMELNLVDGIITDDSDCFLFGGGRVYKNMFNQSKYVESYEAGDLEREFDLDRGKLIKLAHLLGSDYTDGLPGVGPVTALELLAEFNSEDGLERFRDWWKKVQSLDKSADFSSEFRRKFKKNASKLFLSEDFPNQKVTNGYLKPIVDEDETPFEWGIPDLDGLRTFLIGMTGWEKEKIDEMLLPVIKDINKRRAKLEKSSRALIQTTLGDFGNISARKKLEIAGSKRVRKAMESLIEQANKRKK